MLTSEPGTALHQDMQSGRYRPLHDRKVRELFDLTIDYLETHGYVQYEISNFARRTDESSPPLMSRHNLKYWSFAPYIGLGPSAHSFLEPQRSWNHPNVKKYIQELGADKLPIEGKEVLSQEQLMIEAVYLGLRQTKGIMVDVFDKKFGVSFKEMFGEVIIGLEEEGYIKFFQNRCALTSRGMLFLDSVASMFI